MKFHWTFHRTHGDTPHVIKPGWRTTFFELAVIIALGLLLYNSCNKTQKLQEEMVAIAKIKAQPIVLSEDEPKLMQLINVGINASGLRRIEAGTIDFAVLIRAIASLESGNSQFRPDGTLKLNPTSMACGFGQILPTNKERALLRQGLPFFRGGLDITDQDGNIIYTCIHYKGKIRKSALTIASKQAKAKGFIYSMQESEVWESVRRYGTGTKAYVILVKDRYAFFQNLYKIK